MGAKCLRAYEDFGQDDTLPEYAKRTVFEEDDNASADLRLPSKKSRRSIPIRPVFKQRFGGDAEEVIEPDRGPGDLGKMEVWNFGPPAGKTGSRSLPLPALPSLPSPPIKWSKEPTVPVPVTLHVYNIGTASIGRVLNRILKPLGTGAFHCGVEVYGCEWSYSDTTTGTGDGVFPSRPMCCEGHDYAESVYMGKTSTSEDEVESLIRLLKKEWPVYEYDTLKRNCCHFSNELCQRLGVGTIPPWVMNLAGAGAAIAATGDLTCCRQIAVQVGKTCCCAEGGEVPGEDFVEVVDVVDQLPVLPRPRSRGKKKKGGDLGSMDLES